MRLSAHEGQCTGSQALKRRFKFKTRRRREDAIAAALQEAAIAADKDQVRLHQIQILEALFEIFFRVLKRCTASGLIRPASSDNSTTPHELNNGTHMQPVMELSPEAVQKKWPLLNATLQGLSKYTHLIGLEYFNDVMEVLQQLQGSAALPLVLRMRCLLTTVDILHAQNDALNVDRRRMYALLYNALSVCALQPLRDDSEDDEDGKSVGVNQTHNLSHRHSPVAVENAIGTGATRKAHKSTRQHSQLTVHGSSDWERSEQPRHTSCSVLVVKAAMQLLMAIKPGEASRLAAFAKRMSACALHAEPGLCLALLTITARCDASY
jgi:nucleolar complex protein 3